MDLCNCWTFALLEIINFGCISSKLLIISSLVLWSFDCSAMYSFFICCSAVSYSTPTSPFVFYSATVIRSLTCCNFASMDFSYATMFYMIWNLLSTPKSSGELSPSLAYLSVKSPCSAIIRCAASGSVFCSVSICSPDICGSVSLNLLSSATVVCGSISGGH